MEKRYAFCISITETKEISVFPSGTYCTVKFYTQETKDRKTITWSTKDKCLNLRFPDSSSIATSKLILQFYLRTNFNKKKRLLTHEIEVPSYKDIKESLISILIPFKSRKKKRKSSLCSEISVKMQYEAYWSVDFLKLLPNEISLKIMSYLDDQSLYDASLVCKTWQILAESDQLWHSLYKKRYKGVTIVPGFAELWRIRYTSARGPYSTINAAIFEISPSETLLIPSGEYNESINITQPMQIIGDDSDGPVVIQASGRNVLFFRAQTGLVKNLTLHQRGGGRYFCVSITGPGKVVMEDCDISSESLACVAITNYAAPILRRNKIHSGASVGVLVYNHGRGTLTENLIHGHKASCVEVRSHGCPTFVGNMIFDGKYCGILVIEANGVFQENDIFGNQTAGVKIRSGANPIFQGNKIHHGKQRGVVVYNHGQGYFKENEIYGNHHSGVKIRSAGNPTFFKNKIFKGFSAGVLVYNGGQGTLLNNFIYQNALSGIEIRKGGDPRIQHCHIYDGIGGGVYIHSGGLGTLDSNLIYNNARTGVKVKGAWPILKRNQIFSGNCTSKPSFNIHDTNTSSKEIQL